jgi:pyrophosphatase PpaX
VALFDFDGTLVNTTPLILRSFHATWQQVCGLTCADAEYIETFGLPLATAFEQMAERFATAGRIARPAQATSLVEELIATYRSFNERWHDEMIEPFVGIAETLHTLKARGWQMGVVTSKKRAGLERGMSIFQMTELFDVTICAEDSTIHKPRPEPLLLALDKLDATPSETIYIGDSTHDLVAGRAAGVRTAAAGWGPFPLETLQQLQPDYLLRQPEELLHLRASNVEIDSAL